MKILLTGAEGFVGHHMQKALTERGHDFWCYDEETGDDTRDKFKLDRLFESEGFDAVINLAARAGVRRGEDFPEEYFSTNVIGLAGVIAAAEKYGVKKFIHFSSSSVYGAQDKEKATKEEDPKKPRSIYGITKLAGELLLEASDLPYIIIRPFTIVGENGRKEMVVYKWLNQIKAGKPATFYGDGTTFRGYTYIGDILKGVLDLLESDITREDFNMGGAQKITLNELKEIFLEAYPDAKFTELPMPTSDQPYSYADTSKAKEKIGWQHNTNLREKILKMIKE